MIKEIVCDKYWYVAGTFLLLDVEKQYSLIWLSFWLFSYGQF